EQIGKRLKEIHRDQTGEHHAEKDGRRTPGAFGRDAPSHERDDHQESKIDHRCRLCKIVADGRPNAACSSAYLTVRSSSSTDVMPWASRRIPSCFMVNIPLRFAASLTLEAAALSRIRSLSSSLITRSSNTPVRPTYPRPLHSGQIAAVLAGGRKN